MIITKRFVQQENVVGTPNSCRILVLQDPNNKVESQENVVEITNGGTVRQKEGPPNDQI